METIRSMDRSIKELIVEDYVVNHLSNSEICNKYQVNRIFVQRVLKSKGVSLDKKRSRIKVDHGFFNDYNKYSCYWAGFILADGYVLDEKRNALCIKLAKRDIGHLEKFKECIKFEGRIEENEFFCRITISSKKIIQDLSEKFGIESRKTFKCYIDEKIPNEYMDHFIRGYLDGDGTLTKTSCETLGFIGTERTLESIRSFFYESNVRLRTKEKPDITKNKSENIFNLTYSGKSAIRSCEIIYNRSESIIRLDRKFYIFEKWKMK